jgi:hypothetical protein
MKGTLFSMDFVKDSDGNLRLLELNTDTAFTDRSLNNVDFTEFINLILDNNINEVHVIYKKFHENFVELLSQNISERDITVSLKRTEEDVNTIYPTLIEDDPSKFILRCAYDESALFDSVYCKQNEQVYQLFYENNNTDSIAEFYVNSKEFNCDNLRRSFNTDETPDVTVKDISDVHFPIKFYKIPKHETVENSFSEFIDSLGDDKLITNYYSTNTNTQKSIRSFNIIYGDNLDVVNLVDIEVDAIFEKPTSLKIDESNLGLIDEMHYYEFATNYPQFSIHNSYGGIFEEEKITDINKNPVLVSELNIGDSYKSVYIQGSPDTDDPKIFTQWSYEGNKLPEGTYITSSELVNSVKTPLIKKTISHITTDISFSFRASSNQHILIYDSIDNHIKYKEMLKINENTDFLIKSNGDLITITSNEIEILEGDHYVYNLDFEEIDTFVLHGGDLNVKIVSHNSCFPAGTKIKINENESKNIEDILPGDTVVSFDFHNKKITSGRVGKIKKSIQNNLIHLITESGIHLKLTVGHKINANGKWVLAKDLKIGDVLVEDNLRESKIISIEIIEGQFEVYHILNVGNDHTYFANKILVHNFSIFCFPKNTKITMGDYSIKNIEDVNVNDYVLSFNENTNQIESKRVLKLNQSMNNDLVKYTFNGGTHLTCTSDHPIYVNDLQLSSYVPNLTNLKYKGILNKDATLIKIGDVVHFSDGSTDVISNIEELPKEYVQTYIIAVEDNHNFYANNILVHNKQ